MEGPQTNTEALLGELLDRQQITNCMMRYTRGVDRVDEELIRSAYHTDAIDHHGHVNGTVDDFLDWWMPQQDSREVSQHYVTNMAIDLDGDTAHVEAYFTYHHKAKGDPTLTTSGGRYCDRYERRDGEWRIALRVVSVEWTHVSDGSETVELAPVHRGRRDRTDPAYARPLLGPPEPANES
jgi:hypothetical protein